MCSRPKVADAVEKVGGERGWGWLLVCSGKCRADCGFPASPIAGVGFDADATDRRNATHA
jgi:hypothetical protein